MKVFCQEWKEKTWLMLTAIQVSTAFLCEFPLSVRVCLAWASGRWRLHARAFARRLMTNYFPRRNFDIFLLCPHFCWRCFSVGLSSYFLVLYRYSWEGINHSQEGINYSQEGINHSQEGINHSQEGINHSQEGINHSQEYLYNIRPSSTLDSYSLGRRNIRYRKTTEMEKVQFGVNFLFCASLSSHEFGLVISPAQCTVRPSI